MKETFGVLLTIVGAVVGLYVGGYVLFFGGIVQILTHINPLNAVEIAIGLVKFVCSGLAGWGLFAVFLGIGAAIADSE